MKFVNPLRMKVPGLRDIAGALLLLGGLAVGGIGSAHAIVVIDDRYTVLATTDFGVPPNVVDGGTFTSVATTGGTITYHVVESVAIIPGLVVFLGAENTDGEMFMTFSTFAGFRYTVEFDTPQFGGETTHQIMVKAIDGAGTGGTLLANSGGIGINGHGDFSFVAASGSTTLDMVAILGAPNDSQDIGFDNLLVRVPEPATLALLGLGLGGIMLRRRRRT